MDVHVCFPSLELVDGRRVDEVDSILIDESRTPLIISGATEDKSDQYFVCDGFVKTLTKSDYELDEKNKNVILTDKGIDKIEKLAEQKKIQASEKKDDIGFNSFFKYGWKRFYLKWYDAKHPSAEKLCPKSVSILKTVPTVKAAMFAELPSGGKLNPHRDPYAGSLRYHLGLDTPNSEDNIMIDEIFGPILPILTFNCQDDIDEIINKNPNPLALYVFTKSKEFEEKIINRYKFGGGAVNDTIVHLANPKLPFGGIGNSGYGSYHGKYSFELFTHNKSIVKRATWYDNKLMSF